jgi:subtilisin family serine protease
MILHNLVAPLLAVVTLLVGATALAKTLPGAVPGEILLKLDNPDRLPALLLRHDLTLVSRLGARPLFRLKVIGDARVSRKVASLSREAGVLIAEPNSLHSGPEAAKNNVWAIGSQGAYAAQWAATAARLQPAWSLSTGVGSRVAVLDTGVDRNHPLLAGRLLPGRDFVDGDADPGEEGSRADVAFGHGTHVAGLVALAAPGAQIMPIRVLNPQGGGDAWSLAEAMLFAVNPDGNPDTDDGADVINLSLSGLARTRLLDSVALLASCLPPDPRVDADDLSHPSYDDDHRRCHGFGGAVVVAAAGNDGSRSIKTYPAAEGAHGLISVAASSVGGRLAGFSNSGRWIHLAAPGDGVTSSVPGGWGTWSGTSMAAPLVAGAAALMRSAAPALDAKGIARCLTRNTRPLAGTAIGQLDALAALQAIGNRSQCR